MDLAIYINELLGLQGEVNVPGVGIFVQKRVNGYYNEEEGKFYPPSHEIAFNPDSTDDSGLADYISRKKNISPASAKYFIEKYAAGIKQDASAQSATITGLGQLYYEYSTLTFKADKNAQSNDPAFYGFAPVEPYKADESGIAAETPVTPDKPVVEEPVEESVPEVADEVPPQDITTEEIKADTETVEEEPVYEYEEEEKSGSRKWVVILLFVMVLLLAFGVSYQYKPEWFGKKRLVDTTVIINGPAPAPVKTADTVKKSDTVKGKAQDTTAKSTVATVDSLAGKPHFDVIGGSFLNQKEADVAIKNYKSIGVVAKPADMPGRRVKLSLGSYATKEEAENARKELIKAHKAPKDSFTIEIKPKK